MSTLSFSPDQLLAKYRAEREKRLRNHPEGNAQYIEISYNDFHTDPFVEPGFKCESVTEDLDVLLLGAGLGGLTAAARLTQQGIENFKIIDKAGDIGGTWYWNRYFGAACDIESYIYMPLLEETGYIPTEKYAKAPEIFAHCQRIGRKFGLYPKALFQTEMTERRWDDRAKRWVATTDRCRDDHIETIEPTPDAEGDWWKSVFEYLPRAQAAGECTPGYLNNEGVVGDPALIKSAPTGETPSNSSRCCAVGEPPNRSPASC